MQYDCKSSFKDLISRYEKAKKNFDEVNN